MSSSQIDNKIIFMTLYLTRLHHYSLLYVRNRLLYQFYLFLLMLLLRYGRFLTSSGGFMLFSDGFLLVSCWFLVVSAGFLWFPAGFWWFPAGFWCFLVVSCFIKYVIELILSKRSAIFYQSMKQKQSKTKTTLYKKTRLIYA